MGAVVGGDLAPKLKCNPRLVGGNNFEGIVWIQDNIYLLILKVRHETKSKVGFYSCRTSGRNRHHRYSDRYAPPSSSTSPLSCEKDLLFEQHSSAWTCCTQLCIGDQAVSNQRFVIFRPLVDSESKLWCRPIGRARWNCSSLPSRSGWLGISIDALH